MNKLKQIKQTCEYVYNNSKHVTINLENIKELIKKYHFEKTAHWLSNNPLNLLNLNLDELINFLIMYDSINFSYWSTPKWTIKTEYGNLDGSFGNMYALLNLMKIKGHLNFEKITYEEFKNVLKGNIEIPLQKERYQILKENSKVINSKMTGDFHKYTKNITTDTELFNLITSEFISFEDIRIYNGKTIYFYKLANLLTSDILHIKALKEKVSVDTSHLVGCADYKIPQILRNFGILKYSEDLSKIIDKKQEIKENSVYEIEIRANMIKSLELIREELSENINLIDINDILWTLGQDKTKVLKPYHLTRTVSY